MLSGLGLGSGTWNDRFQHSKMPQYDAIKDRFCKFSRKNRGKPSTAPSPTRPPPPDGGRLPPLVSNHSMSPPRPRSSIQEVVVDHVSPDEVFVQSRQRIRRLWDELRIDTVIQQHFESTIFTNVTAENLALINGEIQRLLDLRAATLDVEKKIEVREGFIYLLQDMAEKSVESAAGSTKQMYSLLSGVRKASFDVVLAVQEWGQKKGVDACYLWRGVSYLQKMTTDVAFLKRYDIASEVSYGFVGNPLLNPSRGRDGSWIQATRRIPASEAHLTPEFYAKCEAYIAQDCDTWKMTPRSTHSFASTEQVEAEEVEEVGLLSLDWATPPQPPPQDYTALLAAIRVQKMFRGFATRQQSKRMARLRHAATRIQALVRGFLMKRKVQRLKERKDAAVRIQSLHRGNMRRERLKKLRTKGEAATAIQRVFRGHRGRRVALMLRLLWCRAMTIQKLYRGFRVRKSLRIEREAAANKAATGLQRLWRGTSVREDDALNAKKQKAAVVLQAWQRGNRDRRHVNLLRYVIRRCIDIQAAWRGALVRKNLPLAKTTV